MTTLSEKEQKAQDKAAKDAREKDMTERQNKLNAGKTGVGLRTFLAMTRGKNPMEIQYDAFDEDKTETLPKSIQDFVTLTAADEDTIVKYLISGYNDIAYTGASDPISEHIDVSWPDAAKAQFRLVVRNYSRGVKVSTEDAVALIKPGFDAQFGTASK